MQRHTHDHGAVIVGASQGRGDDREAEWRTLEWAGKIDLADCMERVGAWARGDVAGPDLARGGTAAAGLLRSAGTCSRGQDLRFGAVADPAQVTGEARRHLEVQVMEELIAVVAVEL